ncbi:MAG: sulfatase-like hydrolase/transferase [Verrucomicrobiales bacterium]|nr:sulfatase-like hydrolase/transferase [Verrucomicrobiales bacterium]
MNPSQPSAADLDRRRFLKTSSVAVGSILGSHFLGVVTPATAASAGPVRKNILIFMTDQERKPQWFPSGWEEKFLPNTQRLKRDGLTFENAFCASTMCTPSRTTLFTGLFPVQHQSKDTLTLDMEQSPVEHQLDPTLPNMATCLKEAGYDVIYKGKWHLSKGVQGADPGVTLPDDISRYGFDGWDPPDAGMNTDPTQFGGGFADNDGRYIDDAIAFLQGRVANPSPRPFCLIVSLVNPHDVLAYPKPDKFLGGGYTPDWLVPTDPPIALPPTVGENLLENNKPLAQEQYKIASAGLGILASDDKKLNYLNFYGNLMQLVDSQLGELLAVFDQGGTAGEQLLRDTIIIRTSDHGEMAMCHGGLRQKPFVVYEEALRVPLIWSNPELFRGRGSTQALVSHVDLLPTLCSLVGVPDWRAKGFRGVDYSSILLNPSAPPVQDHVLFTFDDIYAGQDETQFPNGVAHPINRIQMIRTADFKYAKYYGDPSVGDQEEFYDLRPQGGDYDSTYGQPLEMKNLSQWAATRPHPPVLTPEQAVARSTLMRTLALAAAERLQPRPMEAPVPPEDLQLAVVSYKTVVLGVLVEHTLVQVTFLSRSNEIYFLQRSSDLVTWEDIPAVLCGDPQPELTPPVSQPVEGNNGPVALCTRPLNGKAYFRLVWAAKPAGPP